MRLRKSQKAERSRERIIREAKKLFAKFGYHGTSIEVLSEATRLKRGGLYYHIGSKQELLYHILLEATQWPLQRAHVIDESDQAPPEKIRALFRMHMLTVNDNLNEYRILMRDFEALEPKNRKKIKQVRDDYEAIWRSIFDEGTRQGLFRAIDPIFLKGVLGQLNFAFMWLDPKGRLSPDKVADIFFDTLMNGMKSASGSSPSENIKPALGRSTSTRQKVAEA